MMATGNKITILADEISIKVNYPISQQLDYIQEGATINVAPPLVTSVKTNLNNNLLISSLIQNTSSSGILQLTNINIKVTPTSSTFSVTDSDTTKIKVTSSDNIYYTGINVTERSNSSASNVNLISKYEPISASIPYTLPISIHVSDEEEIKTTLQDTSYIQSSYKVTSIPPSTRFTNSITINVINPYTEGINLISDQIFLIIKQVKPQETDPCLQYAESNGFMTELELPVRIGEYYRLLRIPDSISDTIVGIINNPHLKYDDKEIYGRIMITTNHTMYIKLSSGKFIKLTLLPYKSELLNLTN